VKLAHPLRGPLGVTVLALLAGAGVARAEPWSVLGSRHQALGGAGVAIVEPDLAGYWNPAALAFAGGWSARLPGSLQVSVENGALRTIGDVFGAARASAASLARVRASQPLSPGQARQSVGLLAGELPRLDDERASLQTNVAFGGSGHWGAYGFSALSLSVGNLQPVYSPRDLALSSVAGDPATSIVNVVGTGPYDGPLDATLAAEITAAAPAWSPAQAGQLVAFAEQAGVDTADARSRAAVLQIAGDTASADPARNAWSNASGADVQGLSTQEVGFSYADRIPVPIFAALDKRVGFGWTLRYMYGITFRERVSYHDGLSAADAAREIASMPGRTTSQNVGLDLALDARLVEWLRFGIVARNVNGPEFDVAGDGALEVDPQVRAGLGVSAVPHLLLAVDVDLSENGSIASPGFRSRQLAAGAEYQLPLARATTLALRFGAHGNLAPATNHDVMLSGGLGLRWRQLSVDLSGGASTATEYFDLSTGGHEIPTVFSFGLGLGWRGEL